MTTGDFREVIPLGIAECCREWIVPVGMGRGGSCGICGQRPEFKHMLPEEEWLNADRNQA